LRLDWSTFHNSPPKLDVMERILARADEYGVEGIEICGDCHRPDGGLDGCLMFEGFPHVAGSRDPAHVRRVRENLKRVVSACHEANRPVIYWHREVTIPKEIEKDLPSVFDENGEVDFNADAYYDLLREKLREFFKIVPGMDGIVLTLTEAQYSVIHNSDPLRYPPVEIAERIIRTFVEELESLKKRFVFRTFGSIDVDYRILCEAAARALKDHTFDVETKITPFDWSLFLPDNPYLVKPPNGMLSAEFDLAGEFVGETELPYLNPDLILRQLRFARERSCDRLAPRIDRRGRLTLGSLSEINIYTISEANRRPDVTSEEIWREWADMKWGAAAEELLPVMKSALDMLKRSFFIDGHLLSQHPVPTIPMMMLGGIFAVFEPDVSLEIGKDLWSMISTKRSPTREALLKEKEEAVAIADRGAEAMEALAGNIPADQLPLLRDAWKKARHTTRTHLNLARALVTYFEEVSELAGPPHRLEAALSDLVAQAEEGAREFPHGLVAEFAEAMKQNADGFRKFYAAELAARKGWRGMDGIVDSVVCGGFADEYRLTRYMHGSAIGILDGRPVRHAGNRVFPNGFLDYVMKTDPKRPCSLLLLMHSKGGKSKVTVDGRVEVVAPPASGFGIIELDLPEGKESVSVRLEKAGAGFPIFGGLAVRRT
jgi:hypothetical protein